MFGDDSCSNSGFSSEGVADEGGLGASAGCPGVGAGSLNRGTCCLDSFLADDRCFGSGFPSEGAADEGGDVAGLEVFVLGGLGTTEVSSGREVERERE